MITDNTDSEYESCKVGNRRCIYDSLQNFLVRADPKAATGLFDDSLKMPIPKAYLLKGRHGPCDISALLCLFNRLRSFSHSFLHTHALAFNDCERIGR